MYADLSNGTAAIILPRILAYLELIVIGGVICDFVYFFSSTDDPMANGLS